jgi:hypothetical protein
VELMAVVMTAFCRPQYLRETLESWSQVRGLDGLVSRRVCIEPSELTRPMSFLVQERDWETHVNDSRLGVLVNPVESIGAMFREHPEVGFVILAEEDVPVSSDILEYFSWAQRFRDDLDILLVCAHTKTYALRDKPDQEIVRRMPAFFSPLVWGCWREDWFRVLEPTWDRSYSTGVGAEAGWDWNLMRIMRAAGQYSVAPDQSRSDHIGELAGAHCSAEMFPETQDPWHHRDVPVCRYRYVMEDLPDD